MLEYKQPGENISANEYNKIVDIHNQFQSLSNEGGYRINIEEFAGTDDRGLYVMAYAYDDAQWGYACRMLRTNDSPEQLDSAEEFYTSFMGVTRMPYYPAGDPNDTPQNRSFFRRWASADASNLGIWAHDVKKGEIGKVYISGIVPIQLFILPWVEQIFACAHVDFDEYGRGLALAHGQMGNVVTISPPTTLEIIEGTQIRRCIALCKMLPRQSANMYQVTSHDHDKFTPIQIMQTPLSDKLGILNHFWNDDVKLAAELRPNLYSDTQYGEKSDLPEWWV